MSSIKVLDTTDSIQIRELEDEYCLLDINGAKTALSYDAAYDLALRLAYFIQQMDSKAPVENELELH